jgi:NADPH-dependent 7-cyano-7-deazaguanine reductase QueF-like protein
LNAAVDKLLEKYPQEKVLLYLNSFNAMNDAPWESLTKRLQEDKRLQLA